MTTAAAGIRIDGLRKRFGALEVLRGVDVEIPAGRVTALVGPNAAGKTTLVKAVLGLVRPDAGTILLGGAAIGDDPAYRERIGYMPQHPDYPDNLRVGELLDLVDGLRGMTRNGDPRFRGGPDDALLDRFGLRAALDRRVATLSGGMRQKVNAALAFRYAADVLVLDEPTAGLDPLGRARLKDLIRRERDRGATVLITSHVLSELRDLAEHLVYLVDGRKRYGGETASLLRETGAESLEDAVARLMAEDGDADADADGRDARREVS